MAETNAVQETPGSAGEAAVAAENPPAAPRANRGMLRDVPDYVAPPTPRVLQGLLGLAAGVLCSAVSFLLAAMAAGVGVPEAAGAFAACFLASLAWFANGLSLRTGRRGPALWLLATFLYAAVVVMVRIESVRALLLAAQLVHPYLLYAAGVAATLALVTVVVCIVRLFAPVETTAPKSSLLGRWVKALAFGVVLALSPVWLPERLEARAAQIAQGFELTCPPKKEKPLLLGACAEFQLGAGSPQGAVDSEIRFAEVRTELASLAASGVKAVCIGTAGTAFMPHMEERPEDGFEARAIAAVRDAGMKLVLADAPPSYTDPDGVPWPEFARRHGDRVLAYLDRYRPDAVVLCSGVQPYYRLGEITEPAYKGARLPEEQNRRNVVLTPDQWERHLASLAAQVKVLQPKTLTVICVQPWILEEREIYRRALAMPDVDVVAVQAYSSASLVAADRMIHFYDFPQAHEKRLWVLGAWYGFALGEYRPPEEVAQWLSGLAGWAQRSGADAVFARPFGAFVEGGHLQAYRAGNLSELWNQRSVPALSVTCKRWLRLGIEFGRAWDDPPPKYDLEELYERFERLPPRAPKELKEEKQEKDKPHTIEKPDEKKLGS